MGTLVVTVLYESNLDLLLELEDNIFEPSFKLLVEAAVVALKLI